MKQLAWVRGLIALCAVACSTLALAQPKTVRLLVAFPPGGWVAH